MGAMKGNWSKAGYDSEEAYFFKKDQELIKELRKKNLKLLPAGSTQAPKLLSVPPSAQTFCGQKETKGQKKVA